MNQKTLIALGAMAVVAILAVVTLRAPRKGERVGPRERPIAAFKADAVKELELTANGGKDKVTLKRDGAAWKLTAPGQHPADQALVKTAVEQLEKIQFGDLVTEKKERFADLEVGEDKGAHVVARGDGNAVLFDAWIGKSVAGFTMVKPAAKEQVWQSTGLFKYAYAKEAKAWRDHAMLAFARDDTSRLSVEANGQKLVLEKLPPPPQPADAPAAAPPPEAKWKVVESTVKVDPLDDGVANAMIGAMTALSAADFDDTNNYADAGLATPRYRITVTNKGTPATLLLGSDKGDDVWAQVEGKGQIYLLRKFAVEKLAVKPMDFRDKVLVRAKDADLTALDITSGGQAFTLDKAGADWAFGKGAKGELDATKAQPVVSAFEELKGSGFSLATDPATTGLARPQGAVTLHLRDRSVVTLRVGNLTKDNEYFVQKVGSPDVLLLKKFQVERFLKKASDLAKAGPAK